MKVTDILTESIATKQKRNYFIYEAESNWSPGLQASLDANRAELEKTQSAAAEKAQAYKDQQAQLKDKLFQQSAAYNAEMRQQREEEYLARLQRDREEQEKQAARTKPGYQQRPSDGQEDGATPEYGQPHGDAANEFAACLKNSVLTNLNQVMVKLNDIQLTDNSQLACMYENWELMHLSQNDLKNMKDLINFAPDSATSSFTTANSIPLSNTESRYLWPSVLSPFIAKNNSPFFMFLESIPTDL